MTNENTKTKNVSNKIDEKQRKTKINALLTSLKNAKLQRHEKCRIRNQLRKLNHFGALRNRTYLDKNTNKTIIVERKQSKSA